MNRYRLVTGVGTALEAFEADDDTAALALGREMAEKHTAIPPGPHGRTADFVVQRFAGDSWAPIAAWVPRPREPGPWLDALRVRRGNGGVQRDG